MVIVNTALYNCANYSLIICLDLILLFCIHTVFVVVQEAAVTCKKFMDAITELFLQCEMAVRLA